MFTLPPLPYAKDALAPHISAEAIDYHHGKHHKKYIDTLNDLIARTDHEESSLEEIILATKDSRAADAKKLFNNAAQAWNHDFFWQSMTPKGGRAPSGALAKAMDTAFESHEGFTDEFLTQAKDHFGSGWVWLVADKGALAIMTTHDADLPLAHGKKTLLTCDLWEHAHYIDYRNDRPKYVQAFLDHLVNWDHAAAQLKAAS